MQARFIRNILVSCICAVSFAAKAQDASRIYVEPSGWSIGTDVGMADLWGDVGTKSTIEHYLNSKYFDKVTFLGGMFGRYTVHPCFALRFMLNIGTLYATDKWNYDLAKVAKLQGEDAYQRYARNQNAKDQVVEGTVLMEIMPFRFNPESNLAHKRGQPFVGLGIGYMHFTPYSTVGNSPHFVRTYDLHLEGDGFGAGFPETYSLWQPVIPFAIGWRWDLGQHLNLGIEYMWRMTFTDYLDGVSGKYISAADYEKHLSPKDAVTAPLVADKAYWNGLTQPNIPGNLRGNAADKDSYSTLTITFYYKVMGRNGEWWRH